MFSFSMGNVSWLLAKPCLLPLLHPPGCHPIMESRTMDPDLAPLGLCALRKALGKVEMLCVVGQQKQDTKGILSHFSPEKRA